MIAVPMKFKEKIIGVLEGVNKLNGPWTTNDANHILILASQAAVAIQNAQQAEELRRANDELNQLDKLKNDFIAIASHELRTPLGVIMGYASFLQEEAEGEASAHATLVLNSAMHLRNLIEDMTNLRYLQRGDTELIREEVPILAIVEAAIADVEQTLDVKGHQLHLEVPPDPILVNVDRIKFSMSLTNLLNNAIKFTERGGTVSIFVEHHGHEIKIKVTDTGCGIAPDQLERIFEKFYQTEDHMTRKHNGMGLGLSTAKAVVEAHGGHIWAESDGTGKGSTFYITLPLNH
jgi:signal transduction histidine kinase